MTQEANKLQFSRKWIKKARVKIERVDKVEFRELLRDHYHKVGDNHNGPLINISLIGPFKEGYLDNQD